MIKFIELWLKGILLLSSILLICISFLLPALLTKIFDNNYFLLAYILWLPLLIGFISDFEPIEEDHD